MNLEKCGKSRRVLERLADESGYRLIQVSDPGREYTAIVGFHDIEEARDIASENGLRLAVFHRDEVADVPWHLLRLDPTEELSQRKLYDDGAPEYRTYGKGDDYWFDRREDLVTFLRDCGSPELFRLHFDLFEHTCGVADNLKDNEFLVEYPDGAFDVLTDYGMSASFEGMEIVIGAFTEEESV